MDKGRAARIIDYVVTKTKPIWETWVYQSYANLDDIFLARAFEQGGFEANIFYDILKNRGIGPISTIGEILKNYKGNPKYTRSEKGGLAKEFYQELRMGKYGEEGIKFFESVEEFLKNKGGKPGFKFWMLLWFMLVVCNHLKENYQSSFKYYLKKKYCDFKGVDYISDADFCLLSPEEWQNFLRKAQPWSELRGIGPSVFDFIVGDIDEFRFNKDAYKLDYANKYFFQVIGIEALVNSNNRDSIMEFLKSLALPHPYTIREINTGIYANCSRTEKKNFGFCIDKSKCRKCGVNEYCERNFRKAKHKECKKR